MRKRTSTWCKSTDYGQSTSGGSLVYLHQLVAVWGVWPVSVAMWMKDIVQPTIYVPRPIVKVMIMIMIGNKYGSIKLNVTNWHSVCQSQYSISICKSPATTKTHHQFERPFQRTKMASQTTDSLKKKTAWPPSNAQMAHNAPVHSWVGDFTFVTPCSMTEYW